jgi:hypothetical protein
LTTYPAADLPAALAVVALYRRRWAIEQLFRTMKTQGFDVEGLRIDDDVPRCNLVMAALVAAVTVQQLVHARDDAGAQGRLRPVLDAFEEDDVPLLEALCAKLEGKPQRQKNPHPPTLSRLRQPGLRQARRMDRLLRKTRPRRHARRLVPVPSRNAKPPRNEGETQCVNPVARMGERFAVALAPAPPDHYKAAGAGNGAVGV